MINEGKKVEIGPEELEQVSGGSCYQLADDSRFLNSLNKSTDRWNAFRMYMDDYSKGMAIQKAWGQLGISLDFVEDLSGNNVYRLNGQVISQEQARRHAMEVTGHFMTTKDWNW